MLLTFNRAKYIVRNYLNDIYVLAIIAQLLAILEILTLASIYPIFNFILSSASSPPNNSLHFDIITYFFDEDDYLMHSIYVALILVVLGSAWRIFLVKKTNFTVAALRQKITHKILSAYLSKTYQFYFHNHRSEMAKNILSEVDLFVTGYLLPAIAIVTNLTIVCYIFAFLTILSFKITIATVTFYGISYVIIFGLAKPALIDAGHQKVVANKKRFIIVNNSIGSIRDVILSSSKRLYEDEFSAPNETFAKMSARIQTIGQIPRFLIEGLTLSAVLFSLLFSLLAKQSTGLVLDLAIIATFALAALKILPSVQILYNSFAQIRSADSSVLSIHDVVNDLSKNLRSTKSLECLSFNETLEFTDIYFSYPGSKNSTLKEISLTIQRGERIGLMGLSGSGKSTFCDIILGLLEPSSGEIYVDGKAVNRSNVVSWQKLVGYVPQDIFLTDDSVYRNISGQKCLNESQKRKVHAACQAASAADFIEDLPEKYDSKLGDNAVFLSGGQKQRLGIAKAMYRDVSLIVLDEATSALDPSTEAKILETLDGLPDTVAQIVISHNLATLKYCDRIFELRGGMLFEKSA